jgi:RNA polymerase Rpb2, domain 5
MEASFTCCTLVRYVDTEEEETTMIAMHIGDLHSARAAIAQGGHAYSSSYTHCEVRSVSLWDGLRPCICCVGIIYSIIAPDGQRETGCAPRRSTRP